ncbi:MAG: T9SS type A sorting domain-containing protein [Thermoanaerobaculia bacterium]|nr:T9SS type A sorting domain-containing protein [Thermoanaerobaculia bacterium]
MKFLPTFLLATPFTVFLFLLHIPIQAQVFTPLWDVRFGGDGDDLPHCLLLTPDGNYAVGGFSCSQANGDKSENSQGDYDYWLAKTNPAGGKLWDKRFGGDDSDLQTCLLSTSDGGYLLGGSSLSDSSGDKSQHSRGAWDVWLVKTNNAGVKMWDKRFGGTQSDMLMDMVQTPDKGYLLGAISLSGIAGDKTSSAQGGWDFWVIKIDSNGIKQWDKGYGGTSDDRLSGIQPAIDDGYLIAGWSFSDSSGHKSQVSKGKRDFWIIKIDSEGTKIWDQSYGGNGDDVLTRIRRTDDGNYFLGGYTTTSANGDRSQTSQGGKDYWVVSVNANGNVLCEKGFGGTADDELTDIQQLQDNTFRLSGYTFSPKGGDVSEDARGASDFWVVKTDSTCAKCCDKRLGGKLEDNATAYLSLSGHESVLTGYSRSDQGGDKSQNSRGGLDYWVYKFEMDCACMVGNSPEPRVTVQLIVQAGPNPFSDHLRFWMEIPPGEDQVRVRLLNPWGAVLRTNIYEVQGRSQIEDDYLLTNIETGIYLLTIESAQGIQTIKLVKP